jgi:hypothetical protein
VVGCHGGLCHWELLGFEYLGSFSVNNFEAFSEYDEVYNTRREKEIRGVTALESDISF